MVMILSSGKNYLEILDEFLNKISGERVLQISKKTNNEPLPSIFYYNLRSPY